MRHDCPNRCHRCPDLIAILKETGQDIHDPRGYTMPSCAGGEIGGLPMCHCINETTSEGDDG